VRAAGQERLRLPAYLKRAVQDPKTLDFAGQYWEPPQPYAWRHPRPARQWAPRIYEAHAGMAQEAERVGSFNEFTAQVLPRVVQAGYNAIQLMAVQEHPYYGSFGYHVSNLFAVSSRFGTPEDLKALIDAAHGAGLAVYLDLVHSHMVKNVDEGLNAFDGTEYQYFHAGPRGQHPAWDSLLFDYGKHEVQALLLSNVAWWLSEYRFDGLRFDGVTSMLYRDHGLGREFHDYGAYFDAANLDDQAIVYLKLANRVAHQLYPGRVVTIAEEVSGMPGLCRPLAEGGFGFDFRLAMGLPDFWIRQLKEKRDDDWSMAELYHTMMNRRRDEGHIAYAESHDQAMVGDKTLAFRLMDADMYWHMSRLQPRHPVIDRGLALHKLMRLLTFSLGGEGWLNFMGNEFGHPEWIDFPRAGNGNSYKYARRQWSLVDNPDLRYRDLGAWDRAMQNLADGWQLLRDGFIEQLFVDEDAKVLIYRRGPLVFAMNWHPTVSRQDYRIPVPDPLDYQVILDSDAPEYSGFGRVQSGQVYWHQAQPLAGRPFSIQLYLPARSAQVLGPVPMVLDAGLRPQW
jgi:1,4-alpha-glucan branching enzyme